MTNKEIKLELGKIALERCGFLTKKEDLLGALNNVYEWITEEPEVEVDMSDKRNVDYNKESIREIVKHIHRNDNGNHGFGVRATTAFKRLEIETVGQLLELTRVDFIKTRDVGVGLLKRINNALFELYGIEKW